MGALWVRRSSASGHIPSRPLSRRRIDRALLCGAAVGALVLGGCGETAAAGPKGGSPAGKIVSASAVALHLDTGSYSVTSSTTTIKGTVTRGSRVTVNGHRASIHGRYWSRTLHLRLGSNRVTVAATLKGHPAVRKTITVTREKSTAEIEAETPVQETELEPQPAAPHSTTTAPASEACTNGTYVNAEGNTVCRPEESPTAPAGATAECKDGTYSFSESRSGTCSHHGGVARWL